MIQLVATLILFIGLSAIAFWKEAPVPFMAAGAVGLATAFFWFDRFVNAFGLAVSLALLAVSLYYLATAFSAMIRRARGEGDDES